VPGIFTTEAATLCEKILRGYRDDLHKMRPMAKQMGTAGDSDLAAFFSF
jgi:hypothetical protein